MEWKKPSQELIKLLVDRMEPFSAQKKAMFGSTVYFANGYMFIGVHEDHIFLRLPEDGRRELLVSFRGATQFEPMKGRPMREYINECSKSFYPNLKHSKGCVEYVQISYIGPNNNDRAIIRSRVHGRCASAGMGL